MARMKLLGIGGTLGTGSNSAAVSSPVWPRGVLRVTGIKGGV